MSDRDPIAPGLVRDTCRGLAGGRRRASGPAALVALTLALACGLTACGGASHDDGHYRVRAIFANAFGVTPGQAVRVAGARVGSVESVDVTADRRAAVVLRIDDPGFQDFRRDAECSVQPQTAVAGRAVVCLPTQPRSADARLPPKLEQRSFGGQRQALLPVDRTSRPIDLGLLAGSATLREPERLAVIVDELGVGLAGRGPDLRRTIRAALPGLRETDRVLAIVRGQSRQLRQLAVDGDRALAPVAADHDRLGRVVTRAANLQRAFAAADSALDANLARLPQTLRVLEPTMRELSRSADAGGTTVAELRRSAAAGAGLLESLRTFATGAKDPLVDLGKTTDLGRKTLTTVAPTVERASRLAADAAPVARNAASLTGSLERTGGFRSALDAIFFQTLALNGYDDTGHYLRVDALVDRCSAHATTPVAGCAATYRKPAARSRTSSGARRPGEDPEQSLIRRVLGGADPQRLLDAAGRDPVYRPLLQRLDQLRSLRKAGKSAAARRAATTGTSSSSAHGQDAPITIDGGILPGDSALDGAELGPLDRRGGD